MYHVKEKNTFVLLEPNQSFIVNYFQAGQTPQTKQR